MSVQVEKSEKNMAKLTIEVSAEKVEKAIQTVYQKAKKNINIPGFRKGKAPRQLIEKMYGKEVFYNDAIDELLPGAYSEAADECGEELVSRPQIDIVQFESGKPFIFTAEVAVKPEVTLGEYKGVQVEKVPVEVLDEEVEADLMKEREANARTITVEGRAVENGDMVSLDFEGFVDGVPFEGGKGENYDLTIGSGSFIPGFEEQLIGAEIDQEVEVNVTFPEDYQAEELQGKAAVFKCTVKEIKEKELPELDDEFASEVSEFETLEEYKADVKAKITERKEREVNSAKEEQVLEAIINDSDMEIPEAMMLTQQRQMVDEFAQRIQMQGLTIDQYYQMTGNSRDKMIEQVRPQAERRIKTRLVLEAIVKAENITATEEEFEEEIKIIGEAYQIEPDQVKETLPESSIKQIREDLAVRKAAEFARDSAIEE